MNRFRLFLIGICLALGATLYLILGKLLAIDPMATWSWWTILVPALLVWLLVLAAAFVIIWIQLLALTSRP